MVKSNDTLVPQTEYILLIERRYLDRNSIAVREIGSSTVVLFSDSL